MYALILTIVLVGGNGVSIHSIEFEDPTLCAEAAVKWLKDMSAIAPGTRPSALCVRKKK